MGHQKQLEEAQRLLQLETIAAAKALANRQAQEVLEKVSTAISTTFLFNLSEVFFYALFSHSLQCSTFQ